MAVVFEEHVVEVLEELREKGIAFLHEAISELESEVKRQTPPGETQLKGSWRNTVDDSNLKAQVGSPLEQSLWNEFGTGSFAENGDGRKGWWVYIEGKPRSNIKSTTYATEAQAQRAANFLRRVKKLNAFPSNGKQPKKTLRNAYASKKESIISMAREKFKG